MIRLEGLTKVFSKHQGPAIDSVSFDVNDGEIVGFVGLNGAGKTTTIRAAVGVSLPTAGRVEVDGHDIVHDKAEASRGIGWVPELPNFEPNMKAESLMNYFAGYYGIKGPERDRRTHELLKAVSLYEVRGRKFRNFSQGMKKRFSLATSMLSDPKNFMLDEVLNGLDPEGIHFFRELMFGFRKQGKAVLLSSHILAEVQTIADRVVILHKGKLIKTVRASDLSGLGTPSIRLTVRNLDPRALEYIKSYGEVRTEGKAVILSGTSADPAELNAGLVKMGYAVSELAPQNVKLEDYFLDLVSNGEK